MTEAEFNTVNVGDVLLAKNGRHMHITDLDRLAGRLSYYWEAGIMDPDDHEGNDIYARYQNFSYEKHISKGTTHGTHRTLRHKADFKAKP